MPRVLKMPDEATEPERLEAWAREQSRQAKDLSGRAAIRLVVMAADAKRAAANLRAMRSARMRYSQTC